jgi:hypothetical protein
MPINFSGWNEEAVVAFRVSAMAAHTCIAFQKHQKAPNQRTLSHPAKNGGDTKT